MGMIAWLRLISNALKNKRGILIVNRMSDFYYGSFIWI